MMSGLQSAQSLSPTPVAEPVHRNPDAPGRGKSTMAIGQIAKATVAQARGAGIELPRNAQGVVASQIARGADPASVFAAQTQGETPLDGTGSTFELNADDLGGVMTAAEPAVAPHPVPDVVSPPQAATVGNESVLDLVVRTHLQTADASGGDEVTPSRIALDLLR